MAVNNIEIGTGGGDGIYNNIQNVYSASNSSASPSLSFLSNITGYAGSLPVFSVDAEGITGPNLYQSSLKGFQYNQEDTPYELTRYMKDLTGQISNYSNPSNTWFCVLSGTYRIYSWADNNNIWINGTLSGASFDTMDLKTITLTLGDRIEGQKPFTYGYQNIPGMTGAYGGYCGYSFATRNDRQNGTIQNKLLGFPLDNSPTQAGSSSPGECLIGYTTTTGQVTSNLTTVYRTFTGTGQSATYISETLSITRNYYAQSNILQCMWRGKQAVPTNDTAPLHPLTTETKYGWFSQGGHILAMGGAYQRREYPTPGVSSNTLKTRIGAVGGGGTTYTEFSSPTNVDEFVHTDSAPSSTSTGFMAGSPVAVYIDPGVGDNDEGRGMIFAAEQQADGNGAEMTSFVTEKCMSKYTMIPQGFSYVVFLTTYYNGSTDTASVQRYTWNATTSYWVFQESKDLGNSSDGWANNSAPYKFASCRFSQTTTANNAFKISFPFGETNKGAACWADIEANDVDETNIIMGNDMDGWNISSFAMQGSEGQTGGGEDDPEEACSNADFQFTLYSDFPSTSIPVVGQMFYTDANGLIGFTSKDDVPTSNKWYKVNANRTNYAIQFDSPASGRVKAISECP